MATLFGIEDQFLHDTVHLRSLDSSAADPYHLDTDPDPGKKGFSTRKFLKIWKQTLISHALYVFIT